MKAGKNIKSEKKIDVRLKTLKYFLTDIDRID